MYVIQSARDVFYSRSQIAADCSTIAALRKLGVYYKIMSVGASTLEPESRVNRCGVDKEVG